MIRCEKGQVIVEFALLLPIFIALLALTVDVGLFIYDLQRLERAANSAAISAARELPDQDAAQAKALELAELNGFDEGVSVTFEGNLVTVTITKEGGLYFARIFISEPPTLTARAVYEGAAQEEGEDVNTI